MRGQLKNSEILPYLEDLLRLKQDHLSEENWANTRELLQEVIMVNFLSYLFLINP